MKVADNIIEILKECTLKDNILYLPEGQLDRDTYMQIDKILKSLDGKWNRGKKGHVFEVDPTLKLGMIITSGNFIDWKKEYQFFPSPPEVADLIVEWADLKKGMKVLEPSAGRGAICEAILRDGWVQKEDITCVEAHPDNATILKEMGYNVHFGDFLSRHWGMYDAILMNPPFSKGQDIAHIYHAWEHLKDGGEIVSIVSNGTMTNSQKKYVEFRQWAEDRGMDDMNLDYGSFKTSGTMVNTSIIRIRKY